MVRIAAGAVVLTILSLGLGIVYTKGIVVETTSASFVVRSGMPVFEIKNSKMNVRMVPTPAQWPEETATIFRAVKYGVPVTVKLRTASGMFSFDVDGLSEEHDFLIPCESPRTCRAILESVQIDVPEALIGLTANPP